MYSVGQTVLYGTNGVCNIAGITDRQIGKQLMQYYVLKPIFSESSTLFVPTKNQQLVGRIRFVKSAKEIRGILSSLSSPGKWNNDKTKRAEEFKAIITRGDCSELIGLIRLIRSHEQSQIEHGRRLHISDERILKEAEKMVCDEISTALDVSKDEALGMVMKGIH